MLEEEPNDPLLHFTLGTKLLDDIDGNPREAVKHLEAAIEHDESHVASYLALGRAYMRLGREDEAREVLEQGQELASKLHHGEGGDLAPQFQELIAEL